MGKQSNGERALFQSFKWSLGAVALLGTILLAQVASAERVETKEKKDWTVLVFLNGHNNLDPFGAMDINEMEKVGSTDQINLVVQWASSKNGNTKRLLVQKDANPNVVTSPILEDLPRVDMGSARELVNFIRWGVENFPAKHYFVDVWNHGSGWHRKRVSISPLDISNDDFTGNSISTEELGDAMREAAAIMGQKVDIYGSDACLMAMVEVGAQMSDSVHVMVGSQDLEPGEGWPYDKWLERWISTGASTPQEVATALTIEFVKSYQNGSQGNSESTLSAFDLTQQSELNSAVSDLRLELATLSKQDFAKVLQVANQTQRLYYSDYRDLRHFNRLLGDALGGRIRREVLDRVEASAVQYLVSNQTSSGYKGALGISVWLPVSAYSFDRYARRYSALEFGKATEWGDTLQRMLK